MSSVDLLCFKGEKKKKERKVYLEPSLIQTLLMRGKGGRLEMGISNSELWKIAFCSLTQTLLKIDGCCCFKWTCYCLCLSDYDVYDLANQGDMRKRTPQLTESYKASMFITALGV